MAEDVTSWARHESEVNCNEINYKSTKNSTVQKTINVTKKINVQYTIHTIIQKSSMHMYLVKIKSGLLLQSKADVLFLFFYLIFLSQNMAG